MNFLYAVFFVSSLNFLPSAQGAIQNKIFQFSFAANPNNPQEPEGTRWLKLEALRDDIVHFEIYESRGAGHKEKGPREDAIWVSPMLDSAFYSKFTGASQFTVHGDGIETKDLRVKISDDRREISVFDKVRQIPLTTLRAHELNKAIKTVHIEKGKFRDIYGVGNLFVYGKDDPGREKTQMPEETDGDWAGKQWNQRGHGNFRFGLELNDQFDKGSPSISQFPMIFVLGDTIGNSFANYGLLFDQPYKMSWNFQDVRLDNIVGWTASMWGDVVRGFILSGPDLRDLRQDYVSLVGKPPVPPKSAFGHWQSEFGYDNWNEIKKDVGSLRVNGFPLDGVALDLQWFGGTFGQPSAHRMGSLQFNEKEFPNPKANIKDLYQKFGVQLMPIEESYIDSQLADFSALADHRYRKNTIGFNHFNLEKYDACYLARHSLKFDGQSWNPVLLTTDYSVAGNKDTQIWWGGGGMLDWSNPGARLYWHQLKRHALAKMGIFNHWLDLGEPEMYFQDAVYHGLPDIGKFDHGSVHNLYNLFWAQGIAEGYARRENQTELKDSLRDIHGISFNHGARHFAMSRSGTVGSHRYGGMWSGDIFGNMANLRAHAQTQTHLSLLGIDYYSSDLGGFFRDDRKPDDAVEKETVTRWAAASSLIDVPMRPHSWALNELHEDKRFGLDVRGDLESNRMNVRRRYELLPYLYSLAHLAADKGEPVFPPLVYHFQNDLDARKVSGIKMIGPSLLFALVFKEGPVGGKSVYLPEGIWFDYENQDRFESKAGSRKTFPVSLNRNERLSEEDRKKNPQKGLFMLPLFARAGAIIPKMWVDDKTMNTLGKRSDNTVRNELIVRIYADNAPSEFTLTEDDGVSTGYLHGERRQTKLSQQRLDNRAVFQIDRSNGSYAEAPKVRRTQLEWVVGKKVKEVRINGQICKPENDCRYFDDRGVLKVEVGDRDVTQGKRFEAFFE